MPRAESSLTTQRKKSVEGGLPKSSTIGKKHSDPLDDISVGMGSAVGMASSALNRSMSSGATLLGQDENFGKGKDLVSGTWERMGAVGFELFHHNRGALMGACQMFDMISFLLVFVALVSVVPHKSVIKNMPWLKGKIDGNVTFMSDETEASHVAEIRLGLSTIVYTNAGGKVLEFVQWKDLHDSDKYNCGEECKSCQNVEDATKISVIVSCVLLVGTSWFGGYRKSKETDTHWFKLLCTCSAGLTGFFSCLSMLQFRLSCGSSPPQFTNTFGNTNFQGEGDINWSYSSGYVGVLLNVLLSMLAIIIHLMTPSPKSFDDSMYEERVLADIVEHLDEAD